MKESVDNSEVIGHYKGAGLYDSILEGLKKSGIELNDIASDHLSAADEFHIGGTEATKFVADQLGEISNQKILDVGCGIGGPARFIANKTECQVVGIDLTPSFVKTGNALTDLVSMRNSVNLIEGNAADMSSYPDSYDAAYMMHVGMNISDKRSAFEGVSGALKTGSRFVIYDIMRMKEGQLTFPLPWASKGKGSAVDSPANYASILESVGLKVIDIEVKKEFAVEFFQNMMKRMEGGPPPLGLHLVMGQDTPIKVQNVHKQIVEGLIAPVLMVARKD